MRIYGYSQAEAAVEQKRIPEGLHQMTIQKAVMKTVPRFVDEDLNPEGESLYLFLTAKGYEGVHVNLAAHWAGKVKQLLEAVGMTCGGETGEELDLEELHGRDVMATIKYRGDFTNATAFSRVTADVKPARQTPAVKAASGDDGDVPF